MSTATDWNPQLYLKYKNERTQPSIDLVSRINLATPKTIVDIGCGPGNSTQVLAQRWPQSNLVGIDNSPAMIDKAKTDFPQQQWLLADATNLPTNTTYDLVFSNATIQWLPNHEKLIPHFFNLVAPGGALAIQIPLFLEMPVGASIEKIAQSKKWKQLLGRCFSLFTFHPAGFYYDLLASVASSLDIWETHYFHILDSQEAIMDFIRSTGLKPYLDCLPTPEQKKEFEQEILAEVKKHYPLQKDRKVLFPFQRLFFVAYK